MFYLALKDCNNNSTYCILAFKTVKELEDAKDEIENINSNKWDDKDFDGDDFEYVMNKMKTPFETIYINNTISI